MKILVLGVRAVPGVAGGVESHCENLYPLVAAAGIDVEIVVRSAYTDKYWPTQWRGTRIRRLWSPRKSGYEAIVHTFLGVLYAGLHRPDVLHLHSVGPAIFTPLARLLGLRVVVTYHAPDYLQAKWGRLGKWILKTGERMAMSFANEVVCVSQHGALELARIYGREPRVIRNGVPRIETPSTNPALTALGLSAGRYVLHVGRAIEDKRHKDLIHAFLRAKLQNWKLVLVGDMAGNDDYSDQVRRLAAQHPDIVLAGFRSGTELHALFANAGCFALPSAIEGMPIALLEALSAGSPVVASDIPANHEVELPQACYFPVGDIDAMAIALAGVPALVPKKVWQSIRQRVHIEYDWTRIAEQIIRLYRHSSKESELGPASIESRAPY
ncbi:MAG: glycosyltransferase family 4 protein [Burkholderiaceae bacterium]|nr:glycosyltransferase family 4 protein [Burkholderiaceae bacterium]